jgi:ribonuclease T2
MMGTAQASERVDGTFEAAAPCDAYSSFQRGTNPGFVKLSPGEVYYVSEINEPNGQWVRVQIPGLAQPLRWVSMKCGLAKLSSATAAQKPAKEGCQAANTYDSYVLALTWQPGFCEHVDYRGAKPECDALNSGQLSISRLTLHGLWPNKKACGTRYGNCNDGQPFALGESTQETLAPWMPNLFYETTFAKYEWDKHGVCQERGPDQYFQLAQRLVEVIDESPIGSEIKANIGGSFSRRGFFLMLKQKLGGGARASCQTAGPAARSDHPPRAGSAAGWSAAPTDPGSGCAPSRPCLSTRGGTRTRLRARPRCHRSRSARSAMRKRTCRAWRRERRSRC